MVNNNGTSFRSHNILQQLNFLRTFALESTCFTSHNITLQCIIDQAGLSSLLLLPWSKRLEVSQALHNNTYLHPREHIDVYKQKPSRATMPHPREKNCLSTKLAIYTNLMSKTSLGLEHQHTTGSYTNVTNKHIEIHKLLKQPPASPLQEHKCLAKQTTEASMANGICSLTHSSPWKMQMFFAVEMQYIINKSQAHKHGEQLKVLHGW